MIKSVVFLFQHIRQFVAGQVSEMDHRGHDQVKSPVI